MKLSTILMLVLLLAVVCSIAVPASAAEQNAESLGIPHPSTVSNFSDYFLDGNYYAVIFSDEYGTVMLYVTDFPILGDDDGAINVGPPYAYSSLSNGQWLPLTFVNTDANIGHLIDNFIWSSADIINKDYGSVDFAHDPDFFPAAPQVGVVETAKELTPPIMKTMGLLTVLGIGLMALLVVLKVLPKTLRRFLP